MCIRDRTEVGKRGLYRLYVFSGLLGGALQLAMGLAFQSDGSIPIIGASGACYGIMVYAAFMAPYSKVWVFGIFPVQLRILVGILVFLGAYSTYISLVLGSSGGSVAHGAHLGGALFGFLAFRLFRTWFMTADHRPGLVDGAGRWLRQRREERRAKAEAYQREVLDQLLDKVHKEGMSALTDTERRFLEQASKNMKD